MRKTFSNVYVSNTILDSVVDGVDIINLNDNKTELARKLNPYIKRKKPFKFLNFEVFSLGRFMLFLSYKDYPISNFTKPYYKKLGKLEKRKYDNFWGIIVVYLLELVKHDDKTLIKLLKENNLPFNSYKDSENDSNVNFLGTQVAVKDKVNKLHGYCRCVEYVSNLIKTVDIYNDEVIRDILTADFPGIEDTIIKLVDEVTSALKNENNKNLDEVKLSPKSLNSSASKNTKPIETTVIPGIGSKLSCAHGGKGIVIKVVTDNSTEENIDTKVNTTSNKDIDFSKIPLDDKSEVKTDVSKLYEDENK